jgi:glycosyltransferase involved in cell wall biosynthesis
MRIALVTWSLRRAGGVEAYVEAVTSALARRGHEVSVWYETGEPRTREPLDLAPGIETFLLDPAPARAVARLREWSPDLLVQNGIEHPALERALAAVAPAIFVAHNYHGTCISGTKTWTSPRVAQCTKRFGAGCLVHYFPHRCGGRGAATMLRLYRRAGERLADLERHQAIVTLSRHMQDEYVRHGFGERVACIPYGPARDALDLPPCAAPAAAEDNRVRLIVIARLEPPKGVRLALEALPLVADATGRPVHLTLVGDGGERAALAALAAQLCARDGRLAVDITGWVPPQARDLLLQEADLLIVPSLWAEPFGLIGLEAARFGVPAAAFDLGGVRQWLEDGVNGRLAAANPPTAHALASAVHACVGDPTTLARLRRGARAGAARYTVAGHVDGLLALAARFTATHDVGNGAVTCASA